MEPVRAPYRLEKDIVSIGPESPRPAPQRFEDEASLIAPLPTHSYQSHIDTPAAVTELHDDAARSYTSSVEGHTADRQSQAALETVMIGVKCEIL